MAHRRTATLGPTFFLAALVTGLWPAAGSSGSGGIGADYAAAPGISAARPENALLGVSGDRGGVVVISQGRAGAER